MRAIKWGAIGVALASVSACTAAFAAPSSTPAPSQVRVVPAMYKIPVPEPTAPAPAPPPEPKRPPRTFTITGSGDILIHPTLWSQAQSDADGSGPNFKPQLASVRPRIANANYSICHIEQQMSDPNGPITSYPRYYVHPNLAKAMSWAGFDDCSMASNWTFDKGLDGIKRTNAALDAVHVNHSGSAATKESAERIVIRNVNGVRIAHLSYTDPGDSPSIPGADWAINRQSPSEIARDAREARKRGAEIVVVSIAMGAMGSTETSGAQRDAIKTITAGGNVDYVIGHGSHTVQPAEKINNTWVVWHGNLLSSFFPDQVRMHEGLISRAKFAEQPDGRFAVSELDGYPVLSQLGPYREVDMTQKCSGPAPARWIEAYNSIAAIEVKASKEGMVIHRPCGG